MGVMPRFDTLAELHEFLENNATGMAHDTLRSAADSREKRRADAAEVNQAITKRWSEGLAALDAAIFAMGQNGLMMLKRLDEVDAADPNDSHQTVRVVLALQQFNALIVLQEIQVLLQAGFWSGGAARWRALHETAVTAKVIAERDATLAQRYLDHGFVVQTRRLTAYFDEHGIGPVAPAELASRTKKAAALEQAHGVSNASSKFREPYGWAIPLMGMNAKGRRMRPSMEALEKLAGLDHRRLLVASAHGIVHGDSGGIGGTVLMEDGQWLGGPTERFIETVARPTFETLIHLAGATHVGFEPELNDFCELICLVGSSLMTLCGDAIEKFPRE